MGEARGDTPARILFVALGEREVPAFEQLAAIVADRGHRTKAVTWLPRLGSNMTESLAMNSAVASVPPSVEYRVLSAMGFNATSAVARVDRDWSFAGEGQRSVHVRRVLAALTSVFDDFEPTLVVSSVGGETTRLVAEALCVDRDVRSAFYNAIPIPGRYVMLTSLSSPFIPYPGKTSGYYPKKQAVDADLGGELGQPPRRQSARDGFVRAYMMARHGDRSYPNTWLPRKTADYIKSMVAPLIPPEESSFRSDGLKVLYPLHDERDFQVAMRERHALPQSALLTYVAGRLPPEAVLYVKPHPEHLASHHSLLWRELREAPNVRFLAPKMRAAEAISSADLVLTLASSMGFEAAVAGVPVVCYGRPFYGGRGITHDVADPREIVPTLVSAIGSGARQVDVDALTQLMLKWSWPGRFTPLIGDRANLLLLAQGVLDVIDQ